MTIPPAATYRPRNPDTRAPGRASGHAGAPVSEALPQALRGSHRGDVLRIGTLAARTGVSVDALRYYERRGLLRPTGRRASGYREYPPEAAALVRFIKRAQALGFTLAEVEELVRLRDDARRPAAAVAAREVAAAKVRDIDDRVRQLLALRGALADLVETCEATCGPDGPTDDASCPIIGALDEARDDEALDDAGTTPGDALVRLGFQEQDLPPSNPRSRR